jgi:hypothetical protein
MNTENYLRGNRMKVKSIVIAAVVCATCLEWTRLTGTVKGVNRKDGTVTIQNRDGDLLTVPVDYQVTMIEKHDEIRNLTSLKLDEKITLTRIPADKPKEDTEGMAPPEPSQHGQ